MSLITNGMANEKYQKIYWSDENLNGTTTNYDQLNGTSIIDEGLNGTTMLDGIWNGTKTL